MADSIFYIIAGVITASALMAVMLRNLFHCALFLVVALFGVSGVFLYLNVEFLAAVQVLIYVGAVTILIIFGIMLTRNVMDEKTKVINNQFFFAIVVALFFIGIAFKAVSHSPFQGNNHPTVLAGQNNENLVMAPVSGPEEVKRTDVYALGSELLSTGKGFGYAFEFVSILLLSVLVGAIVVARKEPS